MNVNFKQMNGNPNQVDQPIFPTIHVLFPFIPGPQTVADELLAKCKVMSAKDGHLSSSVTHLRLSEVSTPLTARRRPYGWF